MKTASSRERALEEVYHQRRLWPEGNPQPKPPLDQVLPDQAIRAKVEDYLRKSAALEAYWRRSITPDEAPPRPERMAQGAKQPDALRELWAALGNDPMLIAECLARPTLVERALREGYASDERFHGELRRRAEAELRRMGVPAREDTAAIDLRLQARPRLKKYFFRDLPHSRHILRMYLMKSEGWQWHRYLEQGPEGLYDLTRANQQVVNRTPPHIERAVISIRRRLAARATPQTRYSLVGAAQIRAELKALGYAPLPALRTIEGIITRAGLSCPPLRLARRLAQSPYPAPAARDSNELHQVDLVGPRHLQGDPTDYYFLICRDVFDGAVYVELATNREMTTVISFLIRAWQTLGLPERAQFDNGREFCGLGKNARWLSRLIRFGLRLGVEVVFIPKDQPQRNGAIEHFNGWFQPLLLGRRLDGPAAVRRELGHLMRASNEEQVRPQLGYKTTAQYRRSKRLRKLPAGFTLDLKHLPLAAGKVTFIRLVEASGHIRILEQTFKVGKRLKFQYVKNLCRYQ